VAVLWQAHPERQPQCSNNTRHVSALDTSTSTCKSCVGQGHRLCGTGMSNAMDVIWTKRRTTCCINDESDSEAEFMGFTEEEIADAHEVDAIHGFHKHSPLNSIEEEDSNDNDHEDLMSPS